MHYQHPTASNYKEENSNDFSQTACSALPMVLQYGNEDTTTMTSSASRREDLMKNSQSNTHSTKLASEFMADATGKCSYVPPVVMGTKHSEKTIASKDTPPLEQGVKPDLAALRPEESHFLETSSSHFEPMVAHSFTRSTVETSTTHSRDASHISLQKLDRSANSSRQPRTLTVWVGSRDVRKQTFPSRDELDIDDGPKWSVAHIDTMPGGLWNFYSKYPGGRDAFQRSVQATGKGLFTGPEFKELLSPAMPFDPNMLNSQTRHLSTTMNLRVGVAPMDDKLSPAMASSTSPRNSESGTSSSQTLSKMSQPMEDVSSLQGRRPATTTDVAKRLIYSGLGYKEMPNLGIVSNGTGSTGKHPIILSTSAISKRHSNTGNPIEIKTRIQEAVYKMDTELQSSDLHQKKERNASKKDKKEGIGNCYSDCRLENDEKRNAAKSAASWIKTSIAADDDEHSVGKSDTSKKSRISAKPIDIESEEQRSVRIAKLKEDERQRVENDRINTSEWAVFLTGSMLVREKKARLINPEAVVQTGPDIKVDKFTASIGDNITASHDMVHTDGGALDIVTEVIPHMGHEKTETARTEESSNVHVESVMMTKQEKTDGTKDSFATLEPVENPIDKVVTRVPDGVGIIAVGDVPYQAPVNFELSHTAEPIKIKEEAEENYSKVPDFIKVQTSVPTTSPHNKQVIDIHPSIIIKVGRSGEDLALSLTRDESHEGYGIGLRSKCVEEPVVFSVTASRLIEEQNKLHSMIMGSAHNGLDFEIQHVIVNFLKDKIEQEKTLIPDPTAVHLFLQQELNHPGIEKYELLSAGDDRKLFEIDLSSRNRGSDRADAETIHETVINVRSFGSGSIGSC